MAATRPISAVMITRNAGDTIAATLNSLAAFQEVVVYDNGSTDRTVEIARGFPNVVVHEGEFSGFGPTKNRAAGLASNDWIFSIDSDEIVAPDLLASIAGVNLDGIDVVYSVHRINFFRGKRIRYSGWQNDWLLRLYNRQMTGLDDAAVHESVKPPPGGTVNKLEGELLHDSIRERAERGAAIIVSSHMLELVEKHCYVRCQRLPRKRSAYRSLPGRAKETSGCRV